ncbi:MAG: hypothetical protein AAFX45_13185 [Pseudomonadota bacterium]
MSEGARFWTGLAPAGLAVLLVGAASFALTPPRLFPYSDAVLLGGMAALLALGLGLTLPERWFYSDAERLAHAFKSHHGVSDDRAVVALRAVEAAHSAATRLRRADTGVRGGFHPDLAAAAEQSANRLDDVARLIFYKPDQLPKYQALVIRAESVIDAVEDHAKLRARAQNEAEIATSRDMANAGLSSLSDALDASQTREVAQILDRIEVNVATAETLLRPRP